MRARGRRNLLLGPHGENGDISFAYTSDADANTCDAMRSIAPPRALGHSPGRDRGVAKKTHAKLRVLVLAVVYRVFTRVNAVYWRDDRISSVVS